MSGARETKILGEKHYLKPLRPTKNSYVLGRGDSSVGIATGYGLDGPGIESRWGAKFFAHVQTGPGIHPASCTMGTRSFPGAKRPGRGADHPPPSSVPRSGKSRAIPLLPSGPSGLLRGTFTFLLGRDRTRFSAVRTPATSDLKHGTVL
jgi:hypothetical protein